MNVSTIQNELERPSAYYQQIADLLRRRIEAGELAPGTKLPSTQALAKQWSVNVSTVHSAMTLLVREGWLQRIRRRGTFVRHRAPALRRVAIYYKHDVWGEGDSAFQQSLYRALRDLLAEHHIEVRVMIDSRPPQRQSEPLPELLEALESQQVQGVIVPVSAPPHSAWLNSLAGPHVMVASGSSNYRVGFNMAQFMELSIEALVRQDCHSAGFIGPKNLGDSFHQAAETAGLRVDPATVVTRGGTVHHGRYQMRVGYELTQQWCAQSPRPAGLVVYPDMFAAGAVQALLEQRIDVAGDLKLVLHRNADVDLICPFPATFVQNEEREVAQAVLEQLRRQYRGEIPTPIEIGYQIVEHPSPIALQRPVSETSC